MRYIVSLGGLGFEVVFKVCLFGSYISVRVRV